MKLVFLGTSAGAPTHSRNVTSVALQWVQLGRLWLFDCGEGTQHQFQRAPVNLSRLEQIFVTHMHGDHVFGLPGLMASRSAAQNLQSPICLHGPPPLNEYLKTSLSLTHTRIKYPWTFEQIEKGTVYEDEHCTVECRLLNHGIPSFGFAVIEKDQPGEFLVEKAKALGISPGPDYGILKSGGQVIAPNGSVVSANDVLGPPRKGRKIVICGDTGVSGETAELATGADILVHEATFMAAQTERAIEVGHSTTEHAARTAMDAGVKHLVLTHFSPRYEQENSNLMAHLLREAQEIFPNTTLAEDFMTIDLPPSTKPA